MRLTWQLLVAVAFIGGQGVYAVQHGPWPALGLGALVVAASVHMWIAYRRGHAAPRHRTHRARADMTASR